VVSGAADFTVPHCRVLPQAGFSGTIPQPLHVYSKRFMTITMNLFFP